MRFKPLVLKKEGSWVKRTLSSAHIRKTIVAIGIGAALGFLLYYITEGHLMETMHGGDILKSMLIGGFFGLFITNSPCARGRC